LYKIEGYYNQIYLLVVKMDTTDIIKAIFKNLDHVNTDNLALILSILDV